MINSSGRRQCCSSTSAWLCSAESCGFGSCLVGARVQNAYIRIAFRAPGGGDHGLLALPVGGVELLEGVRVGAQALLRRVAGLARDLDDRDALVDQ
jgi:hypothetical protein